MNVAMTDTGIAFQVLQPDPAAAADPADPAGPLGETSTPIRGIGFGVSFVGSTAVAPVGLEKSDSTFNYFLGEQADWRSDVPSYQTVAYEGLYPGIDLQTWGRRSNLKYEFHVAPGADWRQIALHYDGVSGLSINADGTMAVDLGAGWGTMADAAPYIYQVIDGQKIQVPGEYTLVDAWTYSFRITGTYDPARPLVIDPELAWSMQLGGSGQDYGHGIVVDALGSILVAGETSSSGWVSGGWNSIYSGDDVFVVKLDSTGGQIWGTYLGGANREYRSSIAVDLSGNVLVAGGTESPGWVSNGWDTTFNGSYDAFVVKLDPLGEHIWSTYLGGGGWDCGQGIATDAARNVLVTGFTGSPGWVSGGWDTSFNGGYDAFVTKFTPSGSFLWSTYLGGSDGDYGNGIAVDPTGNVLVSGCSYSPGWVSGGWDTTNGNGADAFIAKLSPSGDHLWSTYIGGNAVDDGYGIAVDAFGNVLETGYTNSPGWVSGGWQTTYAGGIGVYNSGGDAYVVKLSPAGAHLWSTYLGGDQEDDGVGIALDASGYALVTGATRSAGWVSGGWDTSYNGGYDAFLAKFSPEGKHVWSSYMGGTGDEWGYAVATDPLGEVFVTGLASSGGTPADGFVAKLTTQADDLSAPSAPADLTTTPVSSTQIRLAWSAASDGETGIANYRVYRNGAVLAVLPAIQLTFTDSGLTDGTNYSYEVSAVNGVGTEGPKAGPVIGTSFTDTTPPTVASSAWLWENYAKVVFSEPVAATSAQNVTNYAITCLNQYIRILSASLQSDNLTVLLTTTDMDTARTYNVVVNNVRDRATVPNTVAANTTAALAFGGLFGQDIGTAAVAGSQSYAGGVYSISASGAGLTGMADGSYYAYRLLPVDGEIVVRVDSMPATATAQAGIMVRSSLDAGSPYTGLFLDGTGAHGRFQYRTTTGGATTSATTNGPAAPYYLKLIVSSEEDGRYISAYIKSASGGSWLPWLTATLPATTDPYYIGLAATTASAAAGAFSFTGARVTAYAPLPDAGPAGVGDSYSTQPGATLTVPYTAGVLVNDTDSDGNSLSAAVSVNPAHGTLSLQGNGAFTYTPAPGYIGTDNFIYTLDDGHGLSQTATASITVADTIAPVVTIKPKVTDDATPSLTGTVDDPAAAIAVTVGGQTYAGVNNGDGTWTLADDVISPALGRGRYDVQVTATDAAGNAGTDGTTNELIVYRLMGDSNLDGQVGTEDFGLMKEYFGLRSGVGWGQGDLNGDGQVGPEDFGLLKEHFGEREDLLPPPLAAAGPLGAGVFADMPEATQDDKVDILDTLAALTPVLDLTVV